MEQEAGLSFCESSLKNAAEELLEMMESSAGRAAVATEGLLAVVAQIALPVLAYYTGKYHLNDTMTFLWLVAVMPLLAMTTIWGINAVVGWIARRKEKPTRLCARRFAHKRVILCGVTFDIQTYLAYRATMVSYFSCLPEVWRGSSTFLPYS